MKMILVNLLKLNFVNRIRPRVKKWRESNYPNVTPTTKKLLKFWKDKKKEIKIKIPFFVSLRQSKQQYG